MQEPLKVFAVGAGMSAGSSSGAALSTNALMREMRGSFFRTLDPRFFTIMLVSVFLHAGIIYYMNHIKLPVQQSMDIEKVSERFARLIIEKPIPKTPSNQIKKTTTAAEVTGKAAPAPSETKTEDAGTAGAKISTAERTRARRVVAARAARVEQMMRTVGVLGMLSGKGSTAKGPAVVDVLGEMGKRESAGSLDDALSKMTGLRKTENPEVLNTTLVKSKDLVIEHKQEIEDLITTMTSAKSVDLVKRGEFIIQKPESIEGSASANAKRDNSAINGIVASHKTSLRMSYENYLKRNPTLSGKITVRFTISAAGTVSSITILENTTGNTDLEQEIKNKVRNWRFDAIDEGDVTVTYPFLFTPAAG
jgi:TonB family protein